MANRQKNQNESTLISWVITVVLLAAAWPIGLFLLFRMLTVGSITSPRPRNRKDPIDVRATEVTQKPDGQPVRKASGRTAARPVDARWGRPQIIAGAILTGLFGLMLINNVVDLVSYGYYSYLLRELIWQAGLTATGAVLLACGIDRRKKAARYRRYLSLIGKRESLSLDSLAKAMPVPYRRACSDLQDMLERGFLPSGYIDAAARRIVFSASGIRETPAQPEKPAQEPQAPKSSSDDMLQQIKAVNDDIADEVMSAKIDRIGEITGKILDYQRKNPDTAAELHSFLNYYLPTTLKILRSYAELEKQGIEGENISTAKASIEGMMDKVVEGFEKHLDKLFQSDVLDITSDVQVLEQMLQKDGLAASELPTLKL